MNKFAVAEREHRALRAGLDLLDIGATAQRLEGDDTQQVQGGRGGSDKATAGRRIMRRSHADFFCFATQAAQGQRAVGLSPAPARTLRLVVDVDPEPALRISRIAVGLKAPIPPIVKFRDAPIRSEFLFASFVGVAERGER